VNNKWHQAFILIPLFLLLFIFSAFVPVEKNKSGETLYNLYCASCHGVSGDGDGELAYLVYPKPRDFTTGKYKIKSTLPGNPPTNQDLFNTINKGMPGTAMPAFNFLKDNEIKSLVDFVKKFSSLNNQNVKQIPIPSDLAPTQELIDLGKLIYNETGCNMCHGESGKGDGPSSNKLTDSRGYTIVPKDFTTGVYVGGATKRDLYLRFMSGIDGTPMPSYGNLSDLLGRPKDEGNKLAWALVHYVKSLESNKIDKFDDQLHNGRITATKTKRFIQPKQFLDVNNNLWSSGASHLIPISRLWQSSKVNYQMINVKVLYNSKYIAAKMEWKDESQNQGLYRVQDFQDGAAMQFSIDGSEGFHGMGSKEHPTDIWFWKAEWQSKKNVYSDILRAYPNRVSDSNVTTYPQLMNDNAYQAGRDANNINSADTKESPIENVVAVGPQTVKSLPGNEQTVMGSGIWDGEKWQVVFVRKLRSDSKQKVDFSIGQSFPIAFAIWNGDEKDRNGQKMVSTWYQLDLKD